MSRMGEWYLDVCERHPEADDDEIPALAQKEMDEYQQWLEQQENDDGNPATGE